MKNKLEKKAKINMKLVHPTYKKEKRNPRRLRFSFPLIGVVALLLWGQLFCQEAEKPQADSHKISTEKIFNEIMQSLPQEKKKQVESASKILDQNQNEVTAEERERNIKEKKQVMIQELPEEIRVKVERAISETDNRIKERQMQLKDLKK